MFHCISVYGNVCVQQAIAVLRAQCESLDSAAQTSSGGVALDALLYILQVLASGPLQ